MIAVELLLLLAAYLYGGVIAVRWMNRKTNGRTLVWLEEAPYAWLVPFTILFWPIVLLMFFFEREDR